MATWLLFLRARVEDLVSTKSAREVFVYLAIRLIQWYQRVRLPATRRISVTVVISKTRTAYMIAVSDKHWYLLSYYTLFTGIKDVNSTIQIPSYLGGTSRITQRMIYDRVNERRSLTFSSQAYNGFKEMHIIMHAARNGVWQNRQLKLVNICFIFLI